MIVVGRRRSPVLSRLSIAALVVVGALGVGGCRRKHVDGTLAVDAVLNAWAAKGFATEPVKSVDPEEWLAGACSRGSVAGLDVLMCEYEADDALPAGERKVATDWDAAGVATGVTVRNGRTLLAIADTAKADPNGRTIVRLIEAFRTLR